MAVNEVKIKVTATNDSKAAFKNVKDDLRDVETASDRAGDALDRFGDDSVSATKDMDGLDRVATKSTLNLSKFGNTASEVRADLRALDEGIRKSKESLNVLAGALANTDDAAKRLDISKAMAKVNQDLARSIKARKIKLDELVDIDTSNNGTSKFKQRLERAFDTAGDIARGAGKPLGVGIGVNAAAAIVPTLVQGLSVAIGSSIGALGIGTGIALAISGDPGIKAAGASLGKRFLEGLQEEAKKNYSGPILQAFTVLEDSAGRVVTKLGNLFQNTSSKIVPFVQDLTEAGESLVDTFVKIGSEADLDALGDSIVILTEGLGDGLEILAGNGEDAGDSLRALSLFIADTIRVTSELIAILDDIASTPFLGTLHTLKQAYELHNREAENSATISETVAEGFQDAANAAEAETSAIAGLNEELKAQTDPVFGLLKAQNDLKDAQEETAKATKKHGANSEEAQEALRKQALAALALEGNVEKLGDSFNGKMTPALRSTLKAAGLTDDAINGLERQFREAKKTGDGFAKQYKANVKVEGVAAARNSLYGLQDTLNDIPRAVNIAMRITGVSSVSKQAAAIRKAYAHGGIIGAAATGGIRSNLTWVGERGPELVQLPFGSTVKSNGDSLNIARNSGGGMFPFGASSGAVARVEAQWVKTINNDFLNALAKSIRIVVKNNGGSVQEVFGRNGGY